MRIVPEASTPLSLEHQRDALAASMPGIDRESAALLLALVQVETGGVPSNNNMGNITANARWEGDAWRPPWFEPNQTNPKLAALHDRMIKGEAPSAFRSYPTAAAGFADFARVLHSTFPSVLEAAKTGDPRAFVLALHDSGYSRDYSAAHIPTFVSLRDRLAPLVEHLPPAPHGAPWVAAAGALLALVIILHRPRRRPRSTKQGAHA
jgi:hypothetical protein